MSLVVRRGGKWQMVGSTVTAGLDLLKRSGSAVSARHSAAGAPPAIEPEWVTSGVEPYFAPSTSVNLDMMMP